MSDHSPCRKMRDLLQNNGPNHLGMWLIRSVLVGMTKWGLDYTFDCTGNVEVMRVCLAVLRSSFQFLRTAHLVVDHRKSCR